MASIELGLREAFWLSPKTLLDHLLWGRLEGITFYDLSDLLDNSAGDLVTTVDEAALSWLEENWGRKTGADPDQIALAWRRFFGLLYENNQLWFAGNALEQYFDSSFFYLRYLTDGDSVDPLGAYLLALGQYQIDRTLANEWWTLGELNPSLVRPEHCPVIFGGFSKMPPSQPKPDVMLGELFQMNIHLNESLRRLANNGTITRHLAAYLSNEISIEFDVGCTCSD